jgi:hypothetical protein
MALPFFVWRREQSLRGVNLMQVHQGKVVEALGYVKSGDRAIGQALEKATPA